MINRTNLEWNCIGKINAEKVTILNVCKKIMENVISINKLI